jgi:hypothetical protein
MGCLFVIVLGSLSAALTYFFGYPEWLMIALGVLWLASLVVSALHGHMGFGGKGNTDLQIAFTGMFLAVAIILPNYAAQKHCDQARTALKELAQAEQEYFSAHKIYTSTLDLLKLTLDPNIQINVTKADEKSFTASASHNQCLKQPEKTPEIFIWDSSRGGLQ